MVKLNKDNIYYITMPISLKVDATTQKQTEYMAFADILSKQFDAFRTKYNELTFIKPIDLTFNRNDMQSMLNKRIKLLDACDSIILCNDWKTNDVCVIEYEYAVSKAKTVLYLEDLYI